MDEQTLEPCPFCGSAWVEMNRPANGAAPFVMCRACHGAGGQVAAASDDETIAVELWNTRAAHSVMAVRIAELEMQRDSARELLVIAAARQESDHQLIRKLEGELRAALAPHPKGME